MANALSIFSPSTLFDPAVPSAAPIPQVQPADAAWQAFLQAAAKVPYAPPPAPNPYPQPAAAQVSAQPARAAMPDPDWYTPEVAPAPPAARSSVTSAPDPDWYTPEPGVVPAAPAAKATSSGYPDWYTPPASTTETAQSTPTSAVRSPTPTDLPDWYTPPEDVPVRQSATNGNGQDDRGFSGILGNAAELVPANIVGLPWTLNHFANYLQAHIRNNTPDATGGNWNGTPLTGADLDATDPIARHLISPDEALQDQAAATGRQWYQPQTEAGRLTQAGLATAATGGRSIAGLVKAALAGGAAQGAQDVFPTSDLAAPLSAAVTHLGASAAQDIAQTGINTVRPLINPTPAGRDTAGAALAPVDNTLPGLANPTAGDLTAAAGGVRAVTDEMGAGLTPSAAMGGLRDNLADRQSALRNARTAVVAPYYAEYRQELPTAPDRFSIGANGGPALDDIPAILPAMRRAATDMQNSSNAGNPYGSPTVPYVDYDEAGSPVMRPGAMTPDLLDRTKIKLNQQAQQADAGLDGQRAAGLKAAAGTLTNFLDQQYPNTYPQARAAYADASVPLQPFQQKPVASVLQQQYDNLGRPIGYALGDGELFDRIAAAKDPGTVVKSFIDAAGGDKSAIVEPIAQAMVGRLRASGAIDPQTGEVNAAALTKETAPYLPTLSMYLPDLAKKFGTAKAAQGTLDQMRQQADLASDIAGGALRDGSGVVTGQAVNQWIARNQKGLQATQGGAALMRLQQIGRAIGGDPSQAASAIADEVLPALTGYGAGGSEGGIFGMMMGHPLSKMIAGPRLAQYREAYSQAIERAVTDPKFAQGIIADAAKRPRSLDSVSAIRQAIGQRALQAVLPTAAATAVARPGQ